MVRPCLRDLFLGPNSTASFKAPKWDFWTKSPSKKVAKPDFLHPRLLQRVFRPVMIQQVQRNFIQFEAGKKLSWLRTDWLGNKFAPGGLNCFEQSVGLVKIQLPQVGNNNSRFGLKIIHHAANHFVFLGFDSEEFFGHRKTDPSWWPSHGFRGCVNVQLATLQGMRKHIPPNGSQPENHRLKNTLG